MKKKFSVEQIVGVLKQAEGGVPVAELIRKTGITEQTYYRWKAKYAGLEVDQVSKQLREENTKLKQLVAELTLDKTMWIPTGSLRCPRQNKSLKCNDWNTM